MPRRIVVAQGVEQSLGLQQAAAALGVEHDGIGAGGDGRLIAPYQQFRADFARHVVAECEHLPELEAGIDVQQREGNRAGVEGLLRQAQHDGRVLADGVEHHRAFKFGGNFAHDVNALGFEQAEIVDL